MVKLVSKSRSSRKISPTRLCKEDTDTSSGKLNCYLFEFVGMTFARSYVPSGSPFHLDMMEK